MSQGALGYVAALLLLGPLPGVSPGTADAPPADVTGVVLVDGEPPVAREWPLDAAVQRVTGEKVYREETWLVGENRGLAHCVVTLEPTKPARRPAISPPAKAVLDKVGVRYVPRVLVVTPGTRVAFRNRASPCEGFQMSGSPRFDHNINLRVQPGTEQTVNLRGPDTCSITCPFRPYTRGYILAVATPYFGVTDATGRFTIRGVPAGEYRVQVWHEAAGRLTRDAGPMAVTVTGKAAAPLQYRVKPPTRRP